MDNVKVYTVNGQAAGASSSLPDWLTRKRTSAKAKGKRAAREHYEGTVELIQGFEFPEASNRLKTTRDGSHVIATGTYKPQIRVWDLDQLTLKFERHTDAENVDFVLLSDDWTKSIHLQNDRSIELHTQGGFHYRTRIPRFGRSIAYHFSSCDAYLGATGNEVFRLNLDQGRFMTPLSLQDDQGDILGVNIVDINPAHQLLAFGIDGNGTAQFWDPRSRSSVGTLRLPASRLLPASNFDSSLGVTAISSRNDGLSYAIGTSTGHTLLYDIRTTKPFATKDQGYGLPIKTLSWIDGGSRMAGDGMVVSADKKVIKIWERHAPESNFVSITPATDLNDVHHVPESGVILTANEGIQMSTYFVPQLGPAPKWASFLENITEEMEDQSTRGAYQDFKFVERKELATLGLDHLVGTPALKPYMHGYFISLKLYDTARLIANPFAYADHREKMIKQKMDKMAETRIRSTKKKTEGVKINKALAEKILKDEEKARKKEERRLKKKQKEDGEDVEMEDAEQQDQGEEEAEESGNKPSLLNDPRFAQVFEDPAFAIDQESREYALLNPSSVAQKSHKTAVEEEEDESDLSSSSDGLGEGNSEDEDASDGSDASDSSDEGVLTKFDPRTRPGQKNARAEAAYARTKERNRVANARVNLVPLKPHGSSSRTSQSATFGQRRGPGSTGSIPSSSKSQPRESAMELTWTPTTTAADDQDDDRPGKRGGDKTRKTGGYSGMVLEKGSDIKDVPEVKESERQGRSQRRKGVRSGSRNAFRKINK